MALTITLNKLIYMNIFANLNTECLHATTNCVLYYTKEIVIYCWKFIGNSNASQWLSKHCQMRGGCHLRKANPELIVWLSVRPSVQFIEDILDILTSRWAEPKDGEIWHYFEYSSSVIKAEHKSDI